MDEGVGSRNRAHDAEHTHNSAMPPINDHFNEGQAACFQQDLDADLFGARSRPPVNSALDKPQIQGFVQSSETEDYYDWSAVRATHNNFLASFSEEQHPYGHVQQPYATHVEDQGVEDGDGAANREGDSLFDFTTQTPYGNAGFEAGMLRMHDHNANIFEQDANVAASVEHADGQERPEMPSTLHYGDELPRRSGSGGLQIQRSAPQISNTSDEPGENATNPRLLSKARRRNKGPCEGLNGKPCSFRNGERLPGSWGGLTLCGRHQRQWENSHPPRPSFLFQEWDINTAIARIRPNVVPPLEYSDPDEPDRSLQAHRNRAHHWTDKFITAARTPFAPEAVLEGEEDKDSHGLECHQATLARKCWTKRAEEYSEEMINIRITLLFYIALRFHEGGPAVYCPGGNNGGYKEDTTLTFVERLELIERILKNNKRVVMDVVEGRGVEAFVRNPTAFDGRKKTNKHCNVSRNKQKSTEEGDEDSEACSDESDTAEQEDEAEEEPYGSASVPASAPPPAAKTSRKRKRPAKRAVSRSPAASANAITPAPKKRAPRRRTAPPAANSQPGLSALSPAQHQLRSSEAPQISAAHYSQPGSVVDRATPPAEGPLYADPASISMDIWEMPLEDLDEEAGLNAKHWYQSPSAAQHHPGYALAEPRAPYLQQYPQQFGYQHQYQQLPPGSQYQVPLASTDQAALMAQDGQDAMAWLQHPQEPLAAVAGGLLPFVAHQYQGQPLQERGPGMLLQQSENLDGDQTDQAFEIGGTRYLGWREYKAHVHGGQGQREG